MAQRKPTDAENRRNLARLNQLLQIPGNELCADCQRGASEWASVNLGVFVCIRCSGLHRQLGTHISKVRSVRLDSWQPDQLQMMEAVGNLAARQIYEANMKKSARRFDVSNDAALLGFIRDKYEHKRWFRKRKKAKGKAKGKRRAKASSPPPPSDSSETSSSDSDEAEPAPNQRSASSQIAAALKQPTADASSDTDDSTSSSEESEAMDETALNAELERLRRLDSNRKCPDCAAEDPMGFRSVCVKYGTLVCSDCKAAHQAFSHRIKSVGMSTFTQQEVEMLRERGNQHARGSWLGALSRKSLKAKCPSKQDRPEVWHSWIKRIYIDKEFYLAESSSRASKSANGRSGKKSSVPKSAPPADQTEELLFLGEENCTSSQDAAKPDLNLSTFFAATTVDDDSSSDDDNQDDPIDLMQASPPEPNTQVKGKDAKSNIMSMFDQGCTVSSMGTLSGVSLFDK